MSRERDRRVNELLDAALDQPPQGRRTFLDQVCREDPGMRDELEELLAQEAHLDGFLEHPPCLSPGGGDAAMRGAAKLPASIGHYRILEVLGRGGMGIVYLAEQSEPIRRQVAIKVMCSGPRSREALQRFEVERQALARMSHPNIAQVFEAGTSDSGEPYVVMEHITGPPITDYCDQLRLGLEPRLDLFRDVCDGIRHAHQKGIIHRDLKPSNILIATDGETATPKIIDFGIAEAVDDEDRPGVPDGGRPAVMGTPAYLSPECLLGRDVDTRADVFGLGLVLYKLLVGALPFRDHAAGEESDLDRYRSLTAPSARLAGLGPRAGSIASSRGMKAADLARRLRNDLDWIVLKALEPEPDERYQSASDLAHDIERYQQRAPVEAGPDSFTYRAGKSIRRHWIGLSSAILVVFAVLAGLVSTSIAARRAQREAARANREAESAKAVSGFLVDLFGEADPAVSHGETVTVTDLLEIGIDRIESQLDGQSLIRARLQAALGTVYVKLGLLSKAEPLLKRALKTRREHLGGDNLEVADSLSLLAFYYQVNSDFDEARRLLAEVLAIQERVLPADHPDVGAILKRQGVNYFYLGDHDEAERLLLQALAILSNAGDSQRTEVAQALTNLGIVYTDMGKLEQAEQRYREAIAILNETLGPDHTHTLTCLGNLARLLKTQGRYDEAEELYRRVLQSQEAILGPEHPEVGTLLNNLGNLLIARGDYERAEPLLRRAVEVTEKALGEDQPGLAPCLNNLASLLLREGRPEAAEPLLRRALTILESSVGPDHATTATALLNLGEVLLGSGRLQEAEQVLGRSLAVFEAVSGPDHLDVSYPLVQLASLNRRLGRPEQAEGFFERARAIVLSNLGPGGADPHEPARACAEYLRATGRSKEAEGLLARVDAAAGG
jgi:serine/threonine protein kinase/Tfp pilus assembly protein PilF